MEKSVGKNSLGRGRVRAALISFGLAQADSWD